MSDRRIGIGLLGLGDMFVRMGIKYDTDEALATVDRVCKIMREVAYESSVELAKEKGAFPLFNWEGYSQSKFIQNLPEKTQDNINTSLNSLLIYFNFP